MTHFLESVLEAGADHIRRLAAAHVVVVTADADVAVDLVGDGDAIVEINLALLIRESVEQGLGRALLAGGWRLVVGDVLTPLGGRRGNPEAANEGEIIHRVASGESEVPRRDIQIGLESDRAGLSGGDHKCTRAGDRGGADIDVRALNREDRAQLVTDAKAVRLAGLVLAGDRAAVRSVGAG